MKLSNKTILVTGGTGSIGSAVVKKLLNTDVKEIIIFSRDEKKQEDLFFELNNTKVKFIIGDIKDYDSINMALKNVNYVFHCGAFKQIGSCEKHPFEAVKTNIIGSNNVIEACINNNIEKAIMLSTDKAVCPCTAMGMTKALMEKTILSLSKNIKTIFSITRFGNVIASRNSVIPLFIKQIKENKNITITDKNMFRFLMTIEDAANLMFTCLIHKDINHGDILLYKSVSCNIFDLAISLKEIFKSNNDFEFIGIRNNEKMYEILMSEEENSRSINDNNYIIIKNDFNYQNKKAKEFNSLNTQILTIKELKEKLLNLDYIKKELELL